MSVYAAGFFGAPIIRAARIATSNVGGAIWPLTSPVLKRQDESGATPGKVPPWNQFTPTHA